jgi:hypothetical protein
VGQFDGWIYNAAGTSEVVTLVLPASGWSMIGSPDRPYGYRFRHTEANAPISTVQVQADRVRVRGGGPN